MAEEKSRLVIEISTENAKRNAEALGRELKSIEKNGDYASKSMDSMSSSARQLATQMAGIVTVGAAIAKMDAYTNLQNRLKLVTTSQTELNRAMSDTFAIAQKTYASWDSVAQVYQRFSDNAKRLKIDMTQTAALTETVSKAVAISGASTQAAEAALTQFGQALASGVLRGEELNSVMEQTPALAKAIAEGMGLTIGQLRTVAAEGKITGDVLVKALTKASTSVDELFAKTDVTIGQSLTQLSNEVTKFTGEAGKGSGAASALASSIQLVSNNFNTFANLGIAVTIGYITMALARKTAVLATSAITWSAETKAVLANNAAKSSSLVIGRSLLGILGGPVGLGLTVAGVAAGYLLMKDNGEEVNKMLELQAKYSDKAADELSKLTGNDRKNAISNLTTLFEDQNKELAKSKESVNAVLFAIRAASVENEKARKVTEDARNGVISYNKAIELLNQMKIPTDLYEKLKQQANQYDENSLKAGKTQKQLGELGEKVKLTGNSFQNAANGVGIWSKSLSGASGEIDTLNEKLAKFSNKKNEALYVTQNAKGWGGDIEKAKALLEFRKELGLGATGRSLNADEQAGFNDYWKAVQDLGKYEEKITNEKRDQTKEAEKKYKYLQSELKMLQRVQILMTQSGLDKYAESKGIPASAIAGLLAQESGGNRNAKSHTGAIGYWQTTSDYRKDNKLSVADSYDLEKTGKVVIDNISKVYAKTGSLAQAILSHNAGEGGARQFMKTGKVSSKASRNKEVAGYLPSIDKWSSYFGGSKGALSDPTAKDQYSELQDFLEAQLKTQQEIDQLKSEYITADYKRQQDHEKKVADLKSHGLNDLVTKENAQYQAETELSKLQFESQVHGWQWIGEEKIKNDAKVNKAVIDASKELGDEQKAEHKKSIDAQAEYELMVFRETQRQKINELAFAVGGAGDQARSYLMERSNPSLYARNQLGSEQFGAQSQLNKDYQSQRGEIFNQGLDPEEQHAKLLEAEKQFLDSKQALNEMYAQKETDLQQSQYESQLQMWGTLVNQAQSTWGMMTQSVKDANGEQSSEYKTMFAMQQAFAIASAVISTEEAASKALTMGPVLGIPMSTLVRTMGYANVAMIAAQTVAGFSEGGYTGHGGKYDPAGIVHKGEVVFSQADIARLGGVGVVEAMRKGQKGYSDGGVVGSPKLFNFPSEAKQQGPIININTPAGFEAQQQIGSDGSITLDIVRKEAQAAAKASWQNLSNNNSFEAKQVRRNTTARPNFK